MPWKVIWESKEGDIRKAWLKVFIDDKGKVKNSEFFIQKTTRSRTYLESIGLDPEQLLELCVALEPIHTKLLQEIAKDSGHEGLGALFG